MDRLLGIEGGQPLYTDDLLHMQQSTVEAIKGIVACVGLGKTDTVLYGCEVVKEYKSIRWNEGFIALGGEVYAVKGGSYELPSGYDELYWVVRKEKYELREFENGSQNYVYERGVAVITAEPGRDDVSGLVSEMSCLGDYILSLAPRYEEESLNAEMADSVGGLIEVSCVRYSNGSAIRFLKVSMRSGDINQFEGGHLFTYDSVIPDVTCIVFLGTKMCMLQLVGGNAFLYNTNGTPVTVVESTGFNVNVMI